MDFKTLQPGDPPWLREIFALEGLKEIVGSKDEPKIVAFFAEARHPDVKDDETAWCAAAAHAMLGRAGVKGTGKLNARSYLDWGTKVTKPQRGDVVVIKRGTSTWQGHVFFWLGETADRIWGIGGNQGNAISVASFPKTALLGYRRPPAAGSARPAPKPTPIENARPEEDMGQGTTIGRGGGGGALPDTDQVARIQEQLRALGYHEVGAIDGIKGPATDNAILIFRKDNHLPLSTAIDSSLRDALMKAQPRVVAPARAEAPAKEVREQAPEAKHSWWSGLIALIGAIFSGIVSFVGWVVSNIGDARALLKPVTDMLGSVPWWAWPVLIALGLLVIWGKSHQAEKAVVTAYRDGERR